MAPGPKRRGQLPVLTVCMFVVQVFLTVRASAGQSLKPLSTSVASKAPRPVPFWANRGRFTLGFQLGFGVEHSAPNGVSHVKMLIAQPQLGIILWDSPRSRLPIKRLEWINEGIFGNAVHPGGRMTGYSVLWRLSGKPHGNTVPFFDAGGGVMNTNLPARIPELTGPTQFMPQGGFGIEHFFAPQRAWVIEYRFFHISNASLEQPNRGLNGSMITIGLRWLRRPARPAGWQPTHQHHKLFEFLFSKD